VVLVLSFMNVSLPEPFPPPAAPIWTVRELPAAKLVSPVVAWEEAPPPPPEPGRVLAVAADAAPPAPIAVMLVTETKSLGTVKVVPDVMKTVFVVDINL